MDTSSFGQRLRELRKARGISQEQLAEAIGVHAITVSRWENNELLPQTVNIRKLAHALHVQEGELLNPATHTDWVLTIRTADNFEEVINLARNYCDCIAQLTTTKQGAALLLSGSYDIFANNDKFKAFIKQLQKARQIVLQNGEAMGWHKPKED